MHSTASLAREEIGGGLPLAAMTEEASDCSRRAASGVKSDHRPGVGASRSVRLGLALIVATGVPSLSQQQQHSPPEPFGQAGGAMTNRPAEAGFAGAARLVSFAPVSWQS